MKIHPPKIGLLVGTLMGGFHLGWAILVLLGGAQPLINFIFWAHMIQPIYVIKAFDPVAAVTLLVMTSITGYVVGYSGAIVWNRIHHSPRAVS